MNTINTSFKILSVFIFMLTVCASFSQSGDVLKIDANIESYNLKPFLINGSKGAENRIFTEKDLNFLRSNGVHFDDEKHRLYKISVRNDDASTQWFFHAMLGNHCTDIQLFGQENGSFYEAKYRHNEYSQSDDNLIREAVLPLPQFEGDSDIFILVNDHLWDYREWYIISESALLAHQNLMSTQTVIYLVTVFIFLIFTFLGAIILKYPALSAYAFYLFATSLFILVEANMTFFSSLYEIPYMFEFLTGSSYGIFVLSFLIYTKWICVPHQPDSWISKLYTILFVSTIVLICFGGLLITSDAGLFFINLISLGVTVYYVIETWLNFKKDIRVRFLLAGTLIFTVFGGLLDLHVQQIINFPLVYYLIVPILIFEFLCIGVGVLYDLKAKMSEMQTIKHTNSDLQTNLSDMEKKVDHAVGAYQILISNKNSGRLNVPPGYFDYPLTQREIQVVHFLNQGYNNQQLAREMHISRNTVKTHLKNIYKKLEVTDREAALEKVKSYGIV